MTVVTNFGREKDLWEYDVEAFLKCTGILPDSRQGKVLKLLSDGEFQQLTERYNPEDTLISVDRKGFSVDYGYRVIHYDFS